MSLTRTLFIKQIATSTKTHIFRAMSTSTSCAIPKPEIEIEGPIEQSIKLKITNELDPVFLSIRNDSWKHAGHRGLQGAANLTESHFNIIVISDKFASIKGLPSRHRLIYKLLDYEINELGVHAIQLKTKTPAEWEKDPSRVRKEKSSASKE